eukprot:CAMPEP_0181467266 /NCGR_PEP_ID=MMETSP1110-20121109/36890_1 /TAXON_ID=174948 /ORGANISM="Symbiodinium sp., Strain CCMP421" /LENGTH=146 /DNA_ID=CAMNT_0023592087 /DNA_START=1097 /DNA_END=1538 /DNA_ORIENTATION=-
MTGHGECRGLELAADFDDCGDAMAIGCSCRPGCTGSLEASVPSISHLTTVEADLAGAGGTELGLKEQAESRSRAAVTSERGRSSEGSAQEFLAAKNSPKLAFELRGVPDVDADLENGETRMQASQELAVRQHLRAYFAFVGVQHKG